KREPITPAPTTQTRSITCLRRACRDVADELRNTSFRGSCGGELPLQVAEVRLGVDRPADDTLECLRRRVLAPESMQLLAQPLADRAELTARDLPVDVVEVLAQPPPDLPADHVPERIRREVAEAAARPVHVLQHAVPVVGDVDVEVAVHHLVPQTRQVAQVEAVHDLLLELETQDDVEVVRRLVRLDADQPGPDVVDRAEPPLLVDGSELTRERLPQARVEPAPERARPADEVLPESRLRLVQPVGRPAGERRSLERRVDTVLVQAVTA